MEKARGRVIVSSGIFFFSDILTSNLQAIILGTFHQEFLFVNLMLLCDEYMWIFQGTKLLSFSMEKNS